MGRHSRFDIDDRDLSIKSFFLGPQAENRDWVRGELSKVIEDWFDVRLGFYAKDGVAISEADKESEWFSEARHRFSRELEQLTALYREETPKFTPRYIGHMVSEISLPALFGHLINLLSNPNLASKEVSQIGGALETEAIGFLRDMVGYGAEEGTGHFTSGGTVANFESLWRARYRMDHWLSLGTHLKSVGQTSQDLFSLAHQGWDQYHATLSRLGIGEEEHRKYSFVLNSPWALASQYKNIFGHDFQGPIVLVPGHKHYSWQKGVSLLGLGDASFWGVDLDEEGRICIEDLEQKIEQARGANRPVMMVVSVAGTTELGEIDPVDRVQVVLDRYRDQEGIHIWHHVDAAYGGFYCSMLGGEDDVVPLKVAQALGAIRHADSVTIDPHKLGYVPYSCGAILLKSQLHNRVSSFAAPYLSREPSGKSWSTTLEGSRAGSGPSATWLTSRVIGFTPSGLGTVLHKGILAKIRLGELLSEVKDCRVIQPLDTNVVCFCLAPEGEALSQTNARTLEIHRRLKEGTLFGVSKTHLSLKEYEKLTKKFFSEWNPKVDVDEVVLMRLVLMNPFILSTETKTKFLEEFVQEVVAEAKRWDASQSV